MLQAQDLSDTFEDAGAIVLGPAIIDRYSCSAALLDFRFGSQTADPLIDELYRRRIPFVVHTGCSNLKPLPQGWPGCRLISKPAEHS